MDPVRNPYTPGAGSKPPALEGRDEELEAFRILVKRLLLGRPEKSLLVTGLRGVGKTVLLNTFKGIAEENGLRTAIYEITHESDLPLLVARMARRVILSLSAYERMKARARRALGVLKAFTLKLPEGAEIALDVEAMVGFADSGRLPEDLADLFVALGEAAREHETGVVFLFDEIQFLPTKHLEALISAIHRVSQESLPLTVVGAGLPQLPALAGDAKSYAERLFSFPQIDRLPEPAARKALDIPAEREGASFEPEASAAIVAFTRGYPYFLQEYGQRVWNLAKGPRITADDVARAEPLVQAQLDENFFRVRMARSTETEIRYLSAMAALGKGPYRSASVAKKLNRKIESVAPIRSRLIAKGLIYSPDHGVTEFTVPRFDDFLRRNYPFGRGRR